jgi:hypothetical protein
MFYMGALIKQDYHFVPGIKSIKCSCEDVNEPFVFHKGGDFLDQSCYRQLNSDESESCS